MYDIAIKISTKIINNTAIKREDIETMIKKVVQVGLCK